MKAIRVRDRERHLWVGDKTFLILAAAFILRARVFYAIYVCVVRGVATVYTDGACARPNPLAGGRALI